MLADPVPLHAAQPLQLLDVPRHRPAAHVGEPCEFLAGTDALHLLDVLAGAQPDHQPRQHPADHHQHHARHVGVLVEFLTSADTLQLLDALTCQNPLPSSWCSIAARVRWRR